MEQQNCVFLTALPRAEDEEGKKWGREASYLAAFVANKDAGVK